MQSAPSTPLPLGLAAIEVNGVQRPACNHLGQPLHPTIEGVRNFWRWFSGSLMVDQGGKPIVLYHGTNESFDAFDRERSREGDSLVFATSNPRVASAFAAFRSTWEGANVVPVYARARDILTIDGGYKPIRDVENTAHFDDMHYGESMRDYAARKGFDGIVFKNVRDDVGPDLLPFDDVYALFETSTLKSALANSGAFDPNSASLSDSAVAINLRWEAQTEQADEDVITLVPNM